jgi:transcriptional regulator with XRE-family HTH domain
MSVRELARRVDVSPSHISQVERGLASFSVKALYNVAAALGMSMDTLFENGSAAAAVPPVTVPDGDESDRRDDNPLVERLIVQRAAARPSIPLAGGTRWERLTPRPEVGAEFMEVVYSPSSGAEPPTDFIRHSSREYGVVIQGALTVQVGFDRTVLHVGDSIAFDSIVPHRFWNETAQEVRAIWFVWDEPHRTDPATSAERTAPDGSVRPHSPVRPHGH